MIADQDLVWLEVKGSPYRYAPIARAQAEKWIAGLPDDRARQRWAIVTAPMCACCGEIATYSLDPHHRCDRHISRNPCAIEGCRRTGATTRYSIDDYLCSQHWRASCPPGSAFRRVYNRLWRLQRKRGGWEGLEERYWRVWAAIVRHARSLTAGDVDMTEINKLFGWAE